MSATLRMDPTVRMLLAYNLDPHAASRSSRFSRFAGASDPPKPPAPPPSGPGGPNGPAGDEDNETGIDVKERPKTHVPRKYKVIFHNDDYTTMEFVIDALMRVFHRTQAEATHIMLTVHKKGSGVAGVYTRDVAETKVEEVTKRAREYGMPLLVTAEPE